MKYHKPGFLHNRFIVAHRSGSRNQLETKMLAALVPSKGCEQKICSSLLSMACRWPSSCSHGVLPVFVSLCLNSPFYKDTSHTGLWLTHSEVLGAGTST